MTDLAHRSSSDLPRFSGMLDAHDRVTGRINYAIDIALPKMIHAKLLRSTSPHARIVSIDTSRAKQVPGVLAVLTGADIAARSDINPWYGPVYRDQPILAIGKVRYVGEPVVAVAAGVAAGFGAWIHDMPVYFAKVALGDQLVIGAFMLASAAVIAGLGSQALLTALTRTGVLASFAAGRTQQRI